MKEKGVNDFKINSVKIIDGNYAVSSNGSLVKEQFIDVDVIPIAVYSEMEIPITLTIKNE